MVFTLSGVPLYQQPPTPQLIQMPAVTASSMTGRHNTVSEPAAAGFTRRGGGSEPQANLALAGVPALAAQGIVEAVRESRDV